MCYPWGVPRDAYIIRVYPWLDKIKKSDVTMTRNSSPQKAVKTKKMKTTKSVLFIFICSDMCSIKLQLLTRYPLPFDDDIPPIDKGSPPPPLLPAFQLQGKCKFSVSSFYLINIYSSGTWSPWCQCQLWKVGQTSKCRRACVRWCWYTNCGPWQVF